MIGEKMVPILQKEDGSYMPESYDIVAYVDSNYGKSPVLIGAKNPELEELIKQFQQHDYKFECPRYVKLGLAEFATQAAIDNFITN